MKRQSNKPLTPRVMDDHKKVKDAYDEIMKSHTLAYAIARDSIYELISEKTGYSAKQVQRILNGYYD